MKAAITHMKAPWPAGATVGSVVEFEGEEVPAWAVGKCAPAGDDAEVTHSMPVAGEISLKLSLDSEEVSKAFHDLREEALARIADAHRAFDEERADLMAKLEAATSELGAANVQIDSLTAKLAEGKAEDAKAAAALAAAEAQAAQEAADAEKRAGKPKKG